jgi:hypothetical protein
MAIVHPAFDTKSKMWFVDGVEAPTLAALRKLLPRRTKIEGYWPNGFIFRRVLSNQPTRAITKEPFSLVHIKKPKPSRAYTPHKTKPKLYDHNAVLGLWMEGLSGPEIGVRLGLPLSTTAGGIVARCREQGDPRALPRSTNGSKIAAAYARKREMLK